MHKSLTDEQVIQQYLPNQPDQCFEALYSRYVKKVYQRCLSMTRDSNQAEDFTQDIFIKVLGKLDSFQERSSFSTWLYSISYNYCVDQLHKAKRLPTSSLASDQDWDRADPMDDRVHEESLLLMQQMLTKLSASERSLLRLKYEDGLSVDDIAQLYGIKVSAVKMRLKRSREKVQALYRTQPLN